MDMLNNNELDKINEIKELYNNIQKKEDINEIINNIEKITEEESKEGKTYLNSLLYPENNKNVKIPSEFPIPSCTYSFHNSIIIPPTDTGEIRFIINPFFLYKERLKNNTAIKSIPSKWYDLDGNVYENFVADGKK